MKKFIITFTKGLKKLPLICSTGGLKFTFLIFIFYLDAYTVQAQQSFNYTQYMNNPLPYNSAYSLMDKSGSANLLGRKQWVGIDGAPSSMSFNGSLPIEKIKGSAGIIILYDQFAVEKLAEVSAFIGKAVQLSESTYLSASFNAGLRDYRATYSELDPFDVKFQNNDIKETTGTLGIGIMCCDPKKYYLGASLPRLSMRSLGKASEKDKRYFRNTWYFSGAYLFDLADWIKVKPATMLTYTRTLQPLVDFSATFYLKEQFGVGLNYRSNKEGAAVVSFIKNNVNVGYSYQQGIGSSTVGGISKGTHEVSVGYRFGYNLLPKLL